MRRLPSNCLYRCIPLGSVAHRFRYPSRGSLSVQLRLSSSQGNDETGRHLRTTEAQPTTTQSSLPRNAASSETPEYLGVLKLTASNLNSAMDTNVPLFLYFMVENHPEVREYTQRICAQVDQVNRRLRDAGMSEAYGEKGANAGLAIKLGMIDCLKEPGLATKFGIDPHMFPLVYFVRRRYTVDKLVGIVSESQVKEAIEAFIDFAKEETKKEAEGKSGSAKVNRHDNDDENALTLLSAAIVKMRNKELAKAMELNEKALQLSMADIAVVNQRYGVDHKKLDRQMWAKLKRETCYNSAPQALCGLAMCNLALEKRKEAAAFVARVRNDFPFAVRDLREVAEAVVQVELVTMTDFDVNKDTYLTMLKYDDLTEDPIVFYKTRLKLVVALYADKSYNRAIEESLRIIRSEPKLLPQLKEARIVPADLSLSPTAKTPGRQLLLKIFEALGDMNEAVVKGRKLMQLYI